MPPARTLRIALAGNPNSGKTSLFNLLSGLHQQVGIWPGVTVERKLGRLEHAGYAIEIIDLVKQFGRARIQDLAHEAI